MPVPVSVPFSQIRTAFDATACGFFYSCFLIILLVWCCEALLLELSNFITVDVHIYPHAFLLARFQLLVYTDRAVDPFIIIHY